MPPRVVGSVDEKGVASDFMFLFVSVFVVAKQGVAKIVPVGNVQKTAGSHRVQLRRRLEPAEFRAVLIRPLPGGVVLLYFSVGKGLAIIVVCFKI